jgi:beta-lactamase class A
MMGAQLDVAGLQRDLDALSKTAGGRLGVCVQDAHGMACTRGSEQFSLQSVMKMLVGIAVLDAVDTKGWKLDDTVVVRKQDLSVFVQPLAKLVGNGEYKTNIGDLVRRGIIDSDSGAADVLVARLGGPEAVQAVLTKKGISGIRLDRDERHLQTEIAGLTWKVEYVDEKVFQAAREALPEEKRAAAYARYQKDPRDTSTPRGMTAMLLRLFDGKLLSAKSTAFVVQAMKDCATGTDRLKAGLAPGWTLAHKTGTSSSWKGMAAATNDVGMMTAPDGTKIAVAVFVGDSRAPEKQRDAFIAKVSALTIQHYR